jgi:PAS domain S-box-containing protein
MPNRGTAIDCQTALVLNVDDDEAVRYVKTRSLKLGGFPVQEASDGATALLMVEQMHPAIVLLDVKLPDISGLDVCRQIKQRWPDIIVIQVSASFVSSSDRVVGLESGADCYLTAPLEPAELIAVARAMLRLRLAEQAAQESGERFRMIVESAVDYAIFTCGLDGRITSWNPGAEALLQYTPEEIIGQPHGRIFTGEDVAADVPEMELRSVRGGRSVAAERWHRRRDGTLFWSSGRMVPLRDRTGEVAGFLKILHDRTAEKQARDDLVALNGQLESRVAERTRMLAEANLHLRQEIEERVRTEEQVRQLQKIEALGQLTGVIAHDFNNLLTAILGGLEVTRRRINDERTVRLVDSAMGAAERGARLVRQLLAFARRQDLELAPVALNPLIMGMRDLLERSIGPSVRMEFSLDDELWPAMADANQMQAALLNLAINARDAMPEGGSLMIGTRNLPGDSAATDAGGDCVEVSVSDSGTGMSDDVRARVFEPFFTTKEAGRGTGLGLAQVYGFVRQCGGDIALESAVGQGTTIRLHLPRSAEQPADRSAGRSESEPVSELASSESQEAQQN